MIVVVAVGIAGPVDTPGTVGLQYLLATCDQRFCEEVRIFVPYPWLY